MIHIKIQLISLGCLRKNSLTEQNRSLEYDSLYSLMRLQQCHLQYALIRISLYVTNSLHDVTGNYCGVFSMV